MIKTNVLQYIVLLISLLLSFPARTGAASSGDEISTAEDSLAMVLDTMTRDKDYFRTLTSIELTLMNSPRFLYYAELKEIEARKQNLDKYVCESYSDRSIYYLNLNNADSFYYWKNLMDPIALEAKEFNYYFYLGNLEISLLIEEGKVELAIQTAKKLYETARQYQSIDGLIAANMSIGKAMNGAKRYEEAYQSFETALDLISKNGFIKQTWRMSIYEDLISLSDKLKIYPQGLEWTYQIEKLIEEIRNERIGNSKDNTYMLDEWCNAILKKAYFNIKLKNLEKASKQLQKVNEYYPELSEKVQMQYHAYLGNYYRATGNYQKALSELNLTYDYYTNGSSDIKLETMEEKARLLSETGALAESVKQYQDLISLKDSMNNKWIDAQVGELRAIYDTDHLKLVNSQLELKSKHSQMQTIVVSLVLTLLALLGISLLYIRAFRIKKKLEYSEEQLLKEKEQLRIAKEKAEEARDLAQKAERKESFFANMSHEIRTPLNAIVGFSNLLVSDEDLTADERTLFTKMINQNCEQLLKLVNDVLDLSRMESGKMSFSFDNYNLSELIDEVYNTNQMLIPKQLNFLKSVPKLPVIAHVDKMRLRQVLFNFINNATKFTAEGYIRIGYELDKEQKKIRLFVEDTGRGIPEEHQKKIFERFYKQVDTDQGTGLGLSICTIIAEKQGGCLSLASEVGKGSCFSVILPFDETLNS